MPQSLAKILVHIIFSTKNRQRFLLPVARPRLYAYMSGILDACESKGILIGGTEDHVHILCSLGRTWAPCKVVEEVKKRSSIWIKPVHRDLRTFAWQNGYGMFSIGQSSVPQLQAYIRNQEEHHRQVSFQDEFRTFLRRYEVEWDERYVWD